ncbi:MAG: response regulator [Polaromonas sp.]|uniref:response regulator n=1 Tax=Polaromonas sp. TaxID=1869339 RepID=UPI0027327599|nr:response regulator [Polaromonas sp.]MDP2818564.1 response regulator [Polaromonas sp.]
MKSILSPHATNPAIIDQVNILIVDDEPKNLTVLESVLDDPGYRLVRANSGQEALLALMAEEFAVLVLDVRMPGMTGFELAQIIKERKKTSRVPIIFLTAYYNEDQHVLEGYGSGAVDYLHKPVNTAVLRSKVAVFAELFSKGRALELANRTLMTEISERRKAEERLRELNETLDRRVTERTNTLELREAELRDANRRKDEFLATLAHELRNPLAPVRNAVQLLRLNGLATPELQWSAEVIDRQIQAMSRLIDDLMDVSRINQGKIELRHDWVTTEDVLRDAVESSRPLIDECGHQLVLTLPAEKLSLHADRTRLTQAFMNLLNNAAKYMDRSGCIEVNAQRDGADVVVTVKDTGIGIPADRLQSVFELFSQVETTLSRSRGGLGIGLSLTQRLVEMHGGRVLARSEGTGLGSEFEVRLPLALEPSSEMSPPPSQALGVERFIPSQELRILIADDNQDACATLASLLELMGYCVRQAHDGQAAVDAAADFDPQVVLLDIGMPRLNGYEACRQIRDQAGGAARTIVACTGWGQAEDRRRSDEAGFNQHLVKPVDPGVLFELLATVAASAKAGS